MFVSPARVPKINHFYLNLVIQRHNNIVFPDQIVHVFMSSTVFPIIIIIILFLLFNISQAGNIRNRFNILRISLNRCSAG